MKGKDILKEYIDVHKRGAAYDLSRAVNKHILSIPFEKTIIVLCIGTDRSTGDSLGPLVGYRLGRYKLPYVRVVGNLEYPVHAANLDQTLERLKTEIPFHYIIAIDACLGMPGHIGRITVGDGPIRPGAGLKKELPETGDMHVTGIVNHGGVEINVPVRMKYDDPTQDLYIDLQPGLQTLNGEQSEWFVRFRQGYDKNGEFKNYSDEFRKENQNEFLKAFFKQHINLKNLGKIDDLSKLIGENIRTSVTEVQKITEYINILRKALNKNYAQQSEIIECSDKKIGEVYFKIIKSE
jgi:putative sporulation protein YyaC